MALMVWRTKMSPRLWVSPPTIRTPMIRLDNISKQHGHQILFIDASMGLQKGEKVGLVGPNGAGKTTL